jgi:hypothetical protein
VYSVLSSNSSSSPPQMAAKKWGKPLPMLLEQDLLGMRMYSAYSGVKLDTKGSPGY